MSDPFKTIAFLFYVSSKPSPISVRHKVSDRKSIAKVVSPESVIERLAEVNNRARAAEELCLLTLDGASLRFAPYPFVDAKHRITEAAPAKPATKKKSAKKTSKKASKKSKDKKDEA